jgi:hypothetical protein
MKIFRAVLLACLAFPCAAADKAKAQESLLMQQQVSAHGIDEAMTKAAPLPLAPGKKLKRTITQKNPVLELDGRRVLYEVYSMSGRAGQPFELQVASFCKCFGFDKTIIVPNILLMSEGKPVGAQTRTEGKAAAGLTPLHYLTTLTGTFPGDAPVQILLYGDTGDVGSTVASVTGSSYVAATGTSLTIGAFAITKSPVGNITIELAAN